MWLIISKIVTPEIIGISSAVISLSLIFSAIVDVGVSTGSVRFLGKSFSQQKTADTRILVSASMFIIFSAILICSVTLLIFKTWIYQNIEFNVVLVSILLIGTLVVFNLLRSILVSSLKTNSLPKIMIITSVCRIAVTVILVLLATGAVAILVGYLSAYIAGIILLYFTLVTIVIPSKKRSTVSFYHACRSIFIASVPTWISQVIGVIGANLATVVVFASVGASEAGSYFIAFAIFYAISSIRDSLFAVAFPVLSNMDDQRKWLVYKLIKMSLVLSLPISLAVIMYSDEVMGLIGSDYIQGSAALKFLMLSILTSTVSIGIGTLVYSYGSYWKVLAIGLATNVCRILFYLILVPSYGNTGAAVSFTIGSTVGFVVSIIVAKKIGMNIFWKELSLIFIVPGIIVFMFAQFHVYYLISILFVPVVSIVLFLRLHVLSKSEMYDYLGLLPKSIEKPLIKIINKI